LTTHAATLRAGAPTMLQATIKPAMVRPRGFRALTPPSQIHVPLVTLEVTVSGTSSATGRRALHAALGNDLRLYVVTIDKRNDRITFRVEVISRTLDEVIVALTGALDRATLGRATITMVRRPRDL
jgi:hypothetical protein